jgi:hypothetical protein
MNNLQNEYSNAANAFSAKGKFSIWYYILFAPIAVPMAIFWFILDLFVITLPDVAIGVSGPTTTYTPEKLSELQKRAASELKDNKVNRLEERRQHLFSAWD